MNTDLERAGLEQRYQQFQEWLNKCPLVVTDYQDFTHQFQITFSLSRLMKKVSLKFIVDQLGELGWDYSCGRMSRSGMKFMMDHVPCWYHKTIRTLE